MKYIEELKPGDIFTFENDKFILTKDFKKQNKQIARLCINISDGSCRWLSDDSMTDFCELFYRDKDNNFLTLKEYAKENY